MRAHFENEMRRQAQEATRHIAPPRLGIVSTYDPNQYAVKVRLQPDGTETGWIQLKSQWVGDEWGLFCPPINGAQVEVTFEKADGEAGLCGSGLFSDEDRPLPVPQGEFWLVHKSGAYVKLTNDPTLTLGDGQGASITIANGLLKSVGAWTHTGNFSATGEVTAKSDTSPVALSPHVHGLSGGPETSVPIPE
jgi:phage baseplate assembly protein gpV